MPLLYGALVHGARSGPDAASTVESRGAASPIVLLCAVAGDLATPALESIKGAFGKVAQADEATAAKLAAAAPPPPYASAVAVVLLAGSRAFVATKGAARCYLERAGALAALDAGTVDLAEGEAIVAASRAALATGSPFFQGPAASPAERGFRNDGLDAALEEALGQVTGALVAVAAARVGA